MSTSYDLIVVGGGINGAAVANLAAYNGLSVRLLEKNSIASGTSSRSSKLLHGGLRYLEHYDFGLVKEALKERKLQLQSAPHLTRPLGFIIPVFTDSPRPLWMMKLGVRIYDLLSGPHCIHPHRKLTKKEIEYFIPELRTDGLVGGVMYYDGQMDDAGLCRANAESARAQGAEISEHVNVIGLEREGDKVVGVRIRDGASGEEGRILAQHIIVTAGPWTNQILDMDSAKGLSRVRTTKGVHITYSHTFCDHAVLLQTADGKRIFFVMPWGKETLIGTTDTDYKGSPDEVGVDDVDIQYLFDELERFFSGHEFSRDHITSTFAGLRPLVFQEGDESKVSRRHVVERSSSGVVYLTGGKYTTYRVMAEDALKACFGRELKDTSEHYPLLTMGTPHD